MSEEEEHIVQNELLCLFSKIDEIHSVISKKVFILEKMKSSSEKEEPDFISVADCADAERRLLANINGSIYKVKQLRQFSTKTNHTRSLNHPTSQWLYTLESFQKQVRNLSEIFDLQKNAANDKDKNTLFSLHTKENEVLLSVNKNLRDGKKVLEKVTNKYLKQPFTLNSEDSVQKNIVQYLYGVSVAGGIFKKKM